MRSQPRRAFCDGAFLMDFSRDTLFCLDTEISYPDCTPPRVMPAYTGRAKCDERTGKHRETEAGEDRDPLHHSKRR
jgi:hypothetical protein